MTLHHFYFVTLVFLVISNGFSCGPSLYFLINTYFSSMLAKVVSPKHILIVFYFFWNGEKQSMLFITLEEKALWLRVPDHVPPPSFTPCEGCQ